MGSIMSAISDDIDDYCSDCHELGVSTRSSAGSPDCYGDHAKWVREQLALKRRGLHYNTEYQPMPKPNTTGKIEIPSVPLSPSKITQLKKDIIPPVVIQVVNRLLAEKLQHSYATIKAKDIRHEVQMLLPEGATFETWWLDFEKIYEAEGWSVEYDGPAYNESYDAYFTFKAKK